MSLYYDNLDYISLDNFIDEFLSFKLNNDNVKMLLDLAKSLYLMDLDSFINYYRNSLFLKGSGRGFYKKGSSFLGNIKILWLKKRLERVSHRKVCIKDKRF